MSFAKTLLIGTEAGFNRNGSPARLNVFVTVKFDGSRLSITGVSGPMASGDCKGSAGQCVNAVRSVDDFAAGWDASSAARLATIWDRWHLNDTVPGTPRQMEWIRANTFPGYPMEYYVWAVEGLTAAGLNPDQGYKYGSAWLTEQVPDTILAELQAMPDSLIPNPWRQ